MGLLKKLTKKYGVKAEDMNDELNQQFDNHKMNVEAAIESMQEFLKEKEKDLNAGVFSKGYTTQKVLEIFNKAYAEISKL